MRPERHQLGTRRSARGRVRALLMILVLLAVGGPLFAACAVSETDALTGTTWYLVSGSERTPAWEWTVPADAQSRYTIRFEEDGSFSSQADCNQLAGTWEARRSDQMTITPGPMTMAACGERSFDILYAGTLGQVRSWSVASTGMVLTIADGGRLNYTSVAPATPSGSPSPTVKETAEPSVTPSPPPSPTATAPVPTVTRTVTATATPTPTTSAPRPSPTTASPTPRPTQTPSKPPTQSPEPTPSPPPGPVLTGHVWQLTAFTLVTPPFQGEVPQDKQARYTIEFRADGTFTAQADCNSVQGTYVPANPAGSSGSLSLSPGPTTIKACDEGSYGDLYLQGLAKTSAFSLDGGRLQLALADSGKLAYSGE